MSRVNRPILLAAALAVAVLGAAVAGVVAHADSTATTIRVTAREYHLTLTPKKANAGAVTIIVTNKGKLSHQIEIAGTGVNKKTKMIRPGKSATLKVTLQGGKYTIWCAVPGHAQLGMKTTLTGTAAAAAGSGSGSSGSGSTGSGTTTTSSSGGGDSAWG